MSNPAQRPVLGIDIGGSGIKGAPVDPVYARLGAPPHD